jgi:hypothetical protein
MGLYQHSIPREAHKRRLLILMEKSEAKSHKNEPWYGALIGDESIALVLVEPEARIDDPVMVGLERSGLHGTKQVLALNPFNSDEYKEPENLVLGLPLAKATIMRDLCQVLGAVSCEVDMKHKSAKSSQWQAGLEAAAPKWGGDAMIKRAMADLWEAKASLGGKYAGGEPDVEQAKAILDRSGLSTDLELVTLVRAAENRKNRVLEQVCRISAVSEATRTVELTAKAIVPDVITCKGDFRFKSGDRTEYTLDFTVRWSSSTRRETAAK